MNTLARFLFLCLRALPVEAAEDLARPILALLFLPHIRELERNWARFDRNRASNLFWLQNAWRLGGYLGLMLQLGKPEFQRVIDQVEIKGENYLKKALQNRAGVVMVSLHLGPWELLPQVFARRGYRVWLGLGNQPEPWLDQILSQMRRSNGVQLAYRFPEMARALRSGAILGFVLDNTRKSRGIKLPGFWFKALRTPFVLARRYKTLILPVKIERRDSRFAVQIGKPSSVSELAATLKEWVLTSPEDWLWLGKA